MAFEQIKTLLANLDEQLVKVAAEIFGKLDELQDALDAAGTVPEDVQEILNSIQTTVSALDSIVPDAEEEEE